MVVAEANHLETGHFALLYKLVELSFPGGEARRGVMLSVGFFVARP